MGRLIEVGYGGQTIDVDAASPMELKMLRLRGYISAAEFENAGEPPRYSSAAILKSRRAERQRHETRSERRRITIRLKAE